jgi:single-strand DNA-binding protein
MINKVILVGYAGADPDVRTLENGTKMARLRVATTERIYNRQTQETKEITEWHNVVLWRQLADVVDKYVRKGSQVYIEGPLRANEWTDKQNVKHYGVDILANELKLLGRRSDGAQGGGGSGSGGGDFGGGSRSGSPRQGGGNGGFGGGYSQTPARDYAPSAPVDPIPSSDPDDLPF